ncbi:MAG: S8 family serine peptidase, partial [Bacteroidaceae bacterium]|nr:S8 family serine peptidase [Bacteroidaceae bacterium]
MRNIILWSMLCLSVTVLAHQPSIPASLDGLYRFRLNLTDKNGCEYSLDQPEFFLSEKSLQRRRHQGIQLDETDLPIPAHYLKQIKEQGATIHSVSKWANTVLVEVGDSLQGEALANLPFVSKSTCVWMNPIPKKQREQKGDSQATRRESVSKDSAALSEDKYGEAQNQIVMLKANKLHEAGFCGQGLTVAVIDGGFLNADVIPLFDNIEVLGTYNVVNCDRSVYESEAHGTAVLSCIGMNKENIMIGTAPAAKFWLIASEDGASEQPVELDYWAAAIEYADSVGVDVVNSSLGYNQFDDKTKDLKFWELDGKSNPASLAASLAADKGIVCVISAGNTGAKTWKKITPPADADHILCVGATDSEGL